VAIATNADGRLGEAGTSDVFEERVNVRRARIMLKEALEIIGAAVADRDPLVGRSGQMERLPRPLEIEKLERKIISARPQEEDVPPEAPISDVRYGLRVGRERPSGAASDDGRLSWRERLINADDGDRWPARPC
jgi:hypothetical protein